MAWLVSWEEDFVVALVMVAVAVIPGAAAAVVVPLVVPSVLAGVLALLGTCALESVVTWVLAWMLE